MLEKIKNDELIFQKAGLVIGTIVGLVLGFVVSDRADQLESIKEEVIVDGPEKV